MSSTVPTMYSQEIESTDSHIEGVIINQLSKYEDSRGWLLELYRNDEVPTGNEPVMAYVSETLPGVVRGPHEHVDQSDYFAFTGPGTFKLYLWDARESSTTYGVKQVAILGEDFKASVIVPPGVVHAYQNISETPGWVFNAANRLYAGANKSLPVDEIRHEDVPNSPFKI